MSVMTWSTYGEFLAFAIVLILIPGPDFAVVTKNTLAGGRRRGRWTALGVTSSNVVQGTAAASGLSALIVRAQPVFEAIKWAGVAYLVFLGAQALRSAIRARQLLLRRKVRRALDGTTGAVLLGFSARLAAEHT
jgi:threonine/homoserine/homoserine lactone efflux protein